MNESKATRISKLEEHETKSDQKKSYCPCRCHWKTLGDFMEIPDSKLIELAEIMERLDPSYAEGLQERIANRPPCTCSCKH